MAFTRQILYNSSDMISHEFSMRPKKMVLLPVVDRPVERVYIPVYRKFMQARNAAKLVFPVHKEWNLKLLCGYAQGKEIMSWLYALMSDVRVYSILKIRPMQKIFPLIIKTDILLERIFAMSQVLTCCDIQKHCMYRGYIPIYFPPGYNAKNIFSLFF